MGYDDVMTLCFSEETYHVSTKDVVLRMLKILDDNMEDPSWKVMVKDFCYVLSVVPPQVFVLLCLAIVLPGTPLKDLDIKHKAS